MATQTQEEGRVVRRWFASYRSALAIRDLRLLFSALTLSSIGTWAYNVALFAYVYNHTHSLGWVGAAGFVRFLSGLLISPYGGVLAERTERVRLMLSSDLISALWSAGMAITAVADGPVVVLLAFAALATITYSVYPPSVGATIPALASEDDLVAANALNGTIENLVVIVGPAIGALLLLAGPAWIVFTVNGASFLASALIVSRIHTRSEPVDVTEEGTAGILRQLSVGFKTLASERSARTLVAFCALASFIYGTDTVLFVAVSEHRLGTGSHGFGYLMAGLGVGGILMALAVDRLAASNRLAWIILLGLGAYCLPTILLTVITSPVLATPVEVVRGAGTLIVDVLAVTALQRAVPGDQLARVFGVFFAVILGAISLGTAVAPALVNAFDLNTALIVMAVGPLVLGLVGLPTLLAIDRSTAEEAALLTPRVTLLEQLEIFAAASRPILEQLARGATEVEFPTRTAIVLEGVAADALYVLVEGEVLVRASGELGDADPRPLATITAPSYFGEIGVLEQVPRTATVLAVGRCRCLRIAGDVLLETLSATPPSAGLLETARRRLAVARPSRKVTYTPTAQPVA